MKAIVPNDELTHTLRLAGIDITADQHARLTEGLRGMNAAGMPVGVHDIIRCLDGLIEGPRHPYRVYVANSQFRGICQACGEQFALVDGRVSRHADARQGATYVAGQFRRARCAGSGRPPA